MWTSIISIEAAQKGLLEDEKNEEILGSQVIWNDRLKCRVLKDTQRIWVLTEE
jgi:hypothetical protein